MCLLITTTLLIDLFEPALQPSCIQTAALPQGCVFICSGISMCPASRRGTLIRAGSSSCGMWLLTRAAHSKQLEVCSPIRGQKSSTNSQTCLELHNDSLLCYVYLSICICWCPFLMDEVKILFFKGWVHPKKFISHDLLRSMTMEIQVYFSNTQNSFSSFPAKQCCSTQLKSTGENNDNGKKMAPCSSSCIFQVSECFCCCCLLLLQENKKVDLLGSSPN